MGIFDINGGNMYTLKQLQDKNMPIGLINDKWVPMRPMNYKYRTLKERIAEACKVFIGKADAFLWPEGQ